MVINTRSRYRPHVYHINKKRFIPFIIVVLLILIMSVLLYLNINMSSMQYTAADFMPDQLLMYFEIEMDQNVPWYYLAAVDKAENIPKEEISAGRSAEIALHLTGIERDSELPLFLRGYNDDKAFIKKVMKEVKHFAHLRQVYSGKIFPLSGEYEYSYEDGYGDSRSYGGDRLHEGTDIMAEKEVPVFSVCGGVVEQRGWNELGGWRLGIRGEDGIYYYYAHLMKYAVGIEKGGRVKKGQLIGYVGDSGYGVEGTTGKFEPHLHFGMYEGKGKSLKAFNPYPFLKAWENNTN